MTELYRGLLQILSGKLNSLIDTLRSHIRSFRKETKDPNSFDIGVLGFWNLQVEITYTLFILFCLVLGIALTAILAILSYPVAAFLNYGGWLLSNTRNPDKEMPIIIKQDNGQEKK